MIDIGYSLIMLLAMASGYLTSRLTQSQLPLDFWQKVKIGFAGFAGAMIGAKVPFLFGDWEAFLSGAAWFSNGKTILTGLAGGYLGVELVKRSMNIQTGTGDSFVVPVAVAIGIGRMGCLYAGCCHGLPTELPWGVVFSVVDDQARHPTQIYESMFHLGFAVFAIWMASRNWLPGDRFKLYLVSYAAYRFATEWLRPEPKVLGGLTAYQLFSLGMILFFGWLLIRAKPEMANEEVPPGLVEESAG